MDLGSRALQIIDRIYAASLEPEGWQDFVDTLADCLGDAAVGFGINGPRDPQAGRAFLHHIEPRYRRGFAEALIRNLPFAGSFGADNDKRFTDLGDLFPEVELAENGFFEEWMKPQGLAPIWPIGTTLVVEGQGPVAWCYIWRREGGGLFREEELDLCETLRPHLVRAMTTHCTLVSQQSRRRALVEIVDRLPTGVLLLDDKGRVVSKNFAAERILEQRDGFGLDAKGAPVVEARRDQEGLRELIQSALDPDPVGPVRAGGFTTVSRPSGKRPFVAMVSGLIDAPGVEQDKNVAIFIADPDSGRVSATDVLQKLYQLTRAEAELVQLLSSGYTLEQAAERRGVTINTARGQLKQVFAKTDTKRQGELVRLVLTGVGTLRES